MLRSWYDRARKYALIARSGLFARFLKTPRTPMSTGAFRTGAFRACSLTACVQGCGDASISNRVMDGTRRVPAGLLAAGLIGAGLFVTGILSGCTEPGETLFTSSAETGDTVQGRSAIVTVRFVNRSSNAAVDVQFFSTQSSELELPDDLFDESFSVRRDIGLAGTGILPPSVTDTIDIPCTANLTLGTKGGQFSDAETGDPLGIGDPRWLEDYPLGLCGAVVTFEFVPRGADSFASHVTITR